MNKEIVDAIIKLVCNSESQTAQLEQDVVELVTIILEQAKSDASELIEARLAGHLYASHTHMGTEKNEG